MFVSPLFCPSISGTNRDLNDAIRALAKELVSLDDPVQRKRVRQQWPQIQPAVTNQLHQPAHPFLAARAERRDNSVVAQACRERLERHGQLPRKDAETRQRPACPERTQCAFECGLRTQSFDGNVDALALSEAANLFDRIRPGVINDDISTHTSCHFRAHPVRFDCDDKSCALELGPRCCAQANRPLRKNGYGVANLHLATFRSGDSRGRNVRQQNHLFITQVIRNFREVRLRVRHQKIFRLRAVDGVTEFPAADWAAALRPIAAQAVIALTARSDRTHQHTLANRVACEPDAEFVNHADGFMTNNETRFHRIFAFEDVQIRSAYRCQRYSDYSFARTRPWNGGLLDSNLIRPAKHERSHR